MKNKILGLCTLVISSLLSFSNETIAQTIYGSTIITFQSNSTGSRTTYTCPQNNPNGVCQVWGITPNGSRFCYVTKMDGTTVRIGDLNKSFGPSPTSFVGDKIEALHPVEEWYED